MRQIIEQGVGNRGFYFIAFRLPSSTRTSCTATKKRFLTAASDCSTSSSCCWKKYQLSPIPLLKLHHTRLMLCCRAEIVCGGTLRCVCAQRGSISPTNLLSHGHHMRMKRGKAPFESAFTVVKNKYRHFASNAAYTCALAAATTSGTRSTNSMRNRKTSLAPLARQKTIVTALEPLHFFCIE